MGVLWVVIVYGWCWWLGANIAMDYVMCVSPLFLMYMYNTIVPDSRITYLSYWECSMMYLYGVIVYLSY